MKCTGNGSILSYCSGYSHTLPMHVTEGGDRAVYVGREVFADAPLVWVTSEVRFSYEPQINETSVRDAFGEMLRINLPLLQPGQITTFTFQSGGSEPVQQTLPQIRAFDDARSQSVALTANALTVDTVRYAEFADYLALVRLAVTSLSRCVPGVRVTRLGLRYIDEIRAPIDVTETRDWRGWIADSLVASLDVLPESPTSGLTGTARFRTYDENTLLFQWGEALGSTVLAANFPLKRAAQPEGRFFVLDLDSFWETENAEVLDVEAVISKLEDLHTPVGQVFYAAVTDRMRAHFRGTSGA